MFASLPGTWSRAPAYDAYMSDGPHSRVTVDPGNRRRHVGFASPAITLAEPAGASMGLARRERVYCPVKAGARFSTKWAMPSLKSAVLKERSASVTASVTASPTLVKNSER